MRCHRDIERLSTSEQVLISPGLSSTQTLKFVFGLMGWLRLRVRPRPCHLLNTAYSWCGVVGSSARMGPNSVSYMTKAICLIPYSKGNIIIDSNTRKIQIPHLCQLVSPHQRTWDRLIKRIRIPWLSLERFDVISWKLRPGWSLQPDG